MMAGTPTGFGVGDIVEGDNHAVDRESLCFSFLFQLADAVLKLVRGGRLMEYSTVTAPESQRLKLTKLCSLAVGHLIFFIQPIQHTERQEVNIAFAAFLCIQQTYRTGGKVSCIAVRFSAAVNQQPFHFLKIVFMDKRLTDNNKAARIRNPYRHIFKCWNIVGNILTYIPVTAGGCLL
ncbi:hypothetical protein SDC9_128811 [bioreactor metagenome]|uniref:Uncharacterized protein n=1 Tax=bioreactor metagenome TaxID=1076179 RepID=A0A645CXT5_9ZZZZ